MALPRESIPMPADTLSPSPAMPWAALLPLIALIPAVLCMIDVVRHPNTRHLTAQTWLVICVFGNVLGLIAYPKYGRNQDRQGWRP
ncbi:PLDc N-terminal domain-containing protein [Streptomyces puniciscabiei]|uniref:PLDc N-terminal domain-containing protein n=1 Tax=Streptomyces puniciscabiei TaxID=164348 RepID=UPI00379D57B7